MTLTWLYLRRNLSKTLCRKGGDNSSTAGLSWRLNAQRILGANLVKATGFPAPYRTLVGGDSPLPMHCLVFQHHPPRVGGEDFSFTCFILLLDKSSFLLSGLSFCSLCSRARRIRSLPEHSGPSCSWQFPLSPARSQSPLGSFLSVFFCCCCSRGFIWLPGDFGWVPV